VRNTPALVMQASKLGVNSQAKRLIQQ